MHLKKQDKEVLFRECFVKMFPTICSFIYSYIKNTEDSKDIAQEVFFKFHSNWENLRDLDAYKSFLYVTAKNLSFDYLKHKKVVTNYEQNNTDISNKEHFLHELTKLETTRLVRKAVSGLPEQSKNIIELSLNGLNNGLIAEHLKISINTVKTLKKSAYSKLRSELVAEYLISIIFIIRIFKKI
ncbi:MAG: sigma-70 family RNA polymerase sigma factor [Marinifilaceae bacterium]